MDFTIEKLRASLRSMREASIRDTVSLGPVLLARAPQHDQADVRSIPPLDAHQQWAPLPIGALWGTRPPAEQFDARPIWGLPADGGQTLWLRAPLAVPAPWRGCPVYLAMTWEGMKQLAVETTVYINNETISGLDDFHRRMLLPRFTHEGSHTLALRSFVPSPQPFQGITLQLVDEAIDRLGEIFTAILDTIERLADTDLARHRLVACLNDAYNALDLTDGWHSHRLAASVHALMPHLLASLANEQLEGTRPTVTIVGHCHVDLAWLWPRWRGRQKTERSAAIALELMGRYPEFTYCMSQPYAYAMLKQDDPGLYRRLREHVEEGRFEPIGPMWVEPELNIPCGESIVRQISFGSRFYQQEFGLDSDIAWLPDMFGAPASLPQILAKCGIRGLITSKLSWNEYNRMPHDTFRWRGIDGSEVLVHFLTTSADPPLHPSEPQAFTYNSGVTAPTLIGTWNHYRDKSLNDRLLFPFGPGDGGGGPSESDLETARILTLLPQVPALRHGRVHDFFEEVYQRLWSDARLPVWVGELYLETHRGTYTSLGQIKRLNHSLEHLYREVEWLDAWATLRGASSHRSQLDEGWKDILAGQAHDLLAGTAVTAAYQEVWIGGRRAREIATQVASEARAFLAAEVAPARHSFGVAVFNSLSWRRNDVVALEAGDDGTLTGGLAAATIALPSQLVETDEETSALLVEVDCPPLGCRTIMPEPVPTLPGWRSSTGTLEIGRDRLANSQLCLTLDDNGNISSLYDRVAQRPITPPDSPTNRLVVYEDRPIPPLRATFPFPYDSWSLDEFYVEKAYPITDVRSMRVIERGPLRAGIELQRVFNRSSIRQRLYLWHNKRRIDIHTTVTWYEREMILRALFPVSINTPAVTCEVQYGTIDRPTHRNTSWDAAKFEFSAHRWIDLSEGGYGVALLSNCKYGYSVRDNVMGLSLVRGTTHPAPEGDRGHHQIVYSIFPHIGDWRSGDVMRAGYELTTPLIAWPHSNSSTDSRTAASGAITRGAEAERSLLKVSADHVIVDAVKIADDESGVVIRLFEAHNQRGPVVIEFGFPVENVIEVDLLERPQRALEVQNNSISFTIYPYKIKAFLIPWTTKDTI